MNTITKEEFNELLSKDGYLTREEEYAVFNYYLKNKTLENRNSIALKNKRLVGIHLRHYMDLGGEADDLIQEGFIGILRAVEKFNPELGNKFSTYASYWIAEAMQTLILDNYNIHLPESFLARLRLYKKVVENYKEKHGKEPTDQYIAKALSVDIVNVVLIRRYLDRSEYSLDFKYGEDNDLSLYGLIEDAKQDLERIGEQIDLCDRLNAHLQSYLTDDEYELLYHRYGLNNSRFETIDELSRRYNLPKTRVVIKLRALHKKIRNMPGIRTYKDFWNSI